ncbi:MAG: LPS export ABC transporter permease LptG [bacterium]|nr:LPS export ABC transporter permease LptG [bacterium]
MKILNKYILNQFIKNLILTLTIGVLLFTVIDFFDRIDNIVEEDAPWLSVLVYFAYKIPITTHFMLPISILISTLFTIGILSKNSEITAMRASGLPLFRLARPLLFTGLALSFVSFGFSELVVPFCNRKSHEIYNIDIKKKNERGSYSQENFWWRNGEKFFSIDMFDSRSQTLLGLTSLEFGETFDINRRTDAKNVNWIDANLGWSMHGVSDIHFQSNGNIIREQFKTFPLPIAQEPRFFYDLELDPESMGYFAFRKYINKIKRDGIPIHSYLADLRSKLSFPFVNFICVLVALPFALKTARSSGIAMNFIAGAVIGFSYYFVHSLSVALGRAELLDPTTSAWAATLLLGFVGLILNWGAEAP